MIQFSLGSAQWLLTILVSQPVEFQVRSTGSSCPCPLMSKPTLTAGASDPTPVILDPKLRIPLDCKLVHAAGAGRRILVLATQDTVDTPDGAARRAALESRGVTVCPCPATVTHTQSTRMSVRHILEVLAGCAVRSMMVEGGASVIEAFLDEGAATATADGKEHNPAPVQNVIITVCPVFVGGVRAAVGGGSAPQDTQGCKGTGGNKGRAIPRHHFPSLGAPPGSQGPGPVYQQLGSDIVVHGSLVAPSRP